MSQPKLWLWALGAPLLLALALPRATAGTLEDVRQRGVLRCGVNGEAPGLSVKDESGAWSGLDVDFCRAVAAATLGRADKVELIPTSTANRFDLLREGQVDLLSRNTTWTMSRDLGLGVSFVATLYYDGQGFMVRRSTNTLSALELSNRPVCVVSDTTSAENAKRYFTLHSMVLKLEEYPNLQEAVKAYVDGKCYALTSDQSQLYAARAALQDSSGHRILPEVISREPLAPVVRQDDGHWSSIVRWTLFTLINAEEAGIDSSNVDAARARALSDTVRLLLDVDGATSALLGLEKGWSYRVIDQVGNYAEIFERNLGKGSALGIKRGLNALWRDGGILYAPPSR